MCVCACVRVHACVRVRACVRVSWCVGGFCSQCSRHSRFISAASVLSTVDLFWQPVC